MRAVCGSPPSGRPDFADGTQQNTSKCAHALAWITREAPKMQGKTVLMNLSGRGDKDIGTVADLSQADFYCRPSCQGQGVKGGLAMGEQIVKVVK